MLADEGLTVVVSNSRSRSRLSIVKPWLRSASPWPVVNASLRFRCVIRFTIDEIWYSSPSCCVTSGIASFFPWYWKQRPMKYEPTSNFCERNTWICRGRTPHWPASSASFLSAPGSMASKRSFPFE